ncbi:ribosomal protein S6 kinase beta-2-like [Spea bombifrons]|uniref:ribosomal protein S6 kinase beta-2-like n=1 Tax=Spea bombifrons TaxID=233779 RepID=UPI002349BA75|nr:ribosomal protein S6 kinase beta-2-like [Spea bombifrons]
MVANIRSYAFFNSINWEELEAGRVAPPFTLERPSLEHLNRIAEQSPSMPSTDPQEPPLSSKEQEMFRGFTFVSPIALTALPAPAAR